MPHKIYFNQFNSDMNSNIGKIEGVKSDDKWMFVIDDCTYSIDQNNVLRWEYSPEGYPKHEKFVQEIVDDTFVISGIRYVVQGDFDENLYVMYFEGKEFHLTYANVSTEGLAFLKD